MQKNFKRMLVISDLHCGHVIGLTPPELQNSDCDYQINKRNKFAKVQRQCWDFFTKTVDSLKPIDILIVNGDAIDGRAEKTGSTELIVADRLVQCDMAIEAIKYVEASKIIMTYGTGYHTGDYEDFENVIYDKVKASKIGSHEWLNVNGVVFDIKHHLGSSGIPHGRYTAIAKDNLWNGIWSEHDEQPKADVVIRSHVHYHVFAGDNKWLGITTPALQAMGSKYGSRRCSGHVDFGMVHFDVNNKGGFTWQSHIAKLEAQKAKAIKL